MSIWYGEHVADDRDLRLCGELAGKRALELGIAPTPAGTQPNAVVVARAGAKTIVVDPSSAAITALRVAAERAEVRVECHQGDLADLGFVTSASIDLVLAVQSLGEVDDLPRLLRQVHRVLRPGSSFVAAMPHPVAAMFGAGEAGAPQHAYGSTGFTFSELYMAFERSNFRLDMVHELADTRVRQPQRPDVLVVRARKQGV